MITAKIRFSKKYEPSTMIAEQYILAKTELDPS